MYESIWGGMAVRKIFIIILLVFASVDVGAQTIEMGLRVEAQGLRRYYSNGYKAGFMMYPYFSCLQLNVALYPMERLSIEGRFGREFLWEHYNGFEYGLFSKYFPWKSIYITGGIAGHSNEGGDGSNSGGSSLSTLIMPAAGAGFKLAKNTSLEVLFQYAGNKKIGGSWYFGNNDEVIRVKETVEWLMKIGLVFGWDLNN
jgi:hypothetical protein